MGSAANKPLLMKDPVTRFRGLEMHGSLKKERDIKQTSSKIESPRTLSLASPAMSVSGFEIDETEVREFWPFAKANFVSDDRGLQVPAPI